MVLSERRWKVLLVAGLLTVAAGVRGQARGSLPLRAPELQAIRAVLAADHWHAGAQVTVRGTVTYRADTLVLQDQTGAIAVVPSGPAQAVPGDEAEVTGRDVLMDGQHRLEDASVRSLWRSSSPPPIALTPDEAAVGDHNDYLVQVEGKLLRVESTADGTRLQMQGDHQFFSAVLPTGILSATSGGERVRSLETNSVLRLTGILSVRPGEYTTAQGSFLLLMRSPADVGVLQGPPWGTTPHILLLIVGLVVLAAVVQAAHVRSVRRQFAAILAERARIARDIHDTLAQGFAGIALQLEVVKGDLDGDRRGAEMHLETALGMVRHSRAEAHQSIATLRAFAQPVELQELLRTTVSGLVAGSRISFHVHLPPLARALRQDVAEHLFRICQEAVANCLQHAAATNLWVSLEQTTETTMLSVRDDGHGFDADRGAAPGAMGSTAPIHFGLIGMRERAARLDARLTLASSTAGTLVSVAVPMEGRSSRRWERWWSRPLLGFDRSAGHQVARRRLSA